jgi:hypothetical protein
VKHEITIQDTATGAVQRLLSGLTTRKKLNQFIGSSVKALVRDHVIKDSNSRHATANALGATPSGFVGKAVESVERAEPKPDEDGVTISLNHPWFARVDGPVTIVPKEKTWLTIPLVAGAYNQRAYRLQGLFFLSAGKDKAFLAKEKEDGKVELWYLLKKSVKQAQDRSRLPADADMMKAAKAGIESFLEFVIAARRAAATA